MSSSVSSAVPSRMTCHFSFLCELYQSMRFRHGECRRGRGEEEEEVAPPPPPPPDLAYVSFCFVLLVALLFFLPFFVLVRVRTFVSLARFTPLPFTEAMEMRSVTVWCGVALSLLSVCELFQCM